MFFTQNERLVHLFESFYFYDDQGSEAVLKYHHVSTVSFAEHRHVFFVEAIAASLLDF